MATKTFSTQYCICVQEDGSLREISRVGTIVTYKAIDYRSGRPVALQVIPSASVDEKNRTQFELHARAAQKLDHANIAKVFDLRVEDEHIVFVSEFLQGETADAWLVAHGPMSVEAVLRVGLQVVSALAGAIFHGMTHRAIQPSNLMILPGATADGGWPMIKMLNFGLAGLKLYSDADKTIELVSPIAPQFASPEQLKTGTVDFRSEVFSLGATMCFLLTGAVPLTASNNGADVGDRILPRTASIPRPMRKLLRHMLRSDREERPHDPVAFTQEIRDCLRKMEKRPGFHRRVSVPPMPTLPVKIEQPRGRTRARSLALAALLLCAVMIVAVWFNNGRFIIHRNRDLATLGVPVGVPESSVAPAAQNEIPPQQSASTVALAPANSPIALPSATISAAPPPRVAASAPNSLPRAPSAASSATNRPPAEPPPPAEGPATASPPPLIAEQSASPTSTDIPAIFDGNVANAPITSSQIAAETAPAPSAAATSSPTGSTMATNRVGQSKLVAAKARRGHASAKRKKRGGSVQSANANPLPPPLRVGTTDAKFVGTTKKGEWILRLPSGDTVVTPPVPNPDDAPIEKHGRVRRLRTGPQPSPSPSLLDQPPVVVLPPGAP